jgi:uncharacterized membrane protein
MQTRNVLERFNSLDSLEIAMQVFQESMLVAYIQAGVIGLLMLLAATLICMHRVLGWHLWLVCLAVSVGGMAIAIALNGVSVGAITRLILLAGFAYISLRSHQSAAWMLWFKPPKNA